MSETTEAASEFKLPAPGEKHACMKPLEGTFKSEVKMWMGPGEPTVSTGKMINSFHINGLFLHQDYAGDGTEGVFANFLGKGYFGYNSVLGCFEGFWIDISTDQMQLETGQVDESGKKWEMISEVSYPGSGAKIKKTDRHRSNRQRSSSHGFVP